ncbi:alpha/beta hydrolase fold domain-containing protein [uncultured Actinomyces sp.]|uniref:alpha/beta hydrolase n=1 Tax=uncultured Actinomyces sp. TaxID=249061 RepID=UPI0028E91BED|nr:alpha/beta hydrolase fold domain-containing protein [uncultured Actinomyces sp.]
MSGTPVRPTRDDLPRPPYDSATAAVLAALEPLGFWREMTVDNLPTWRSPVEDSRAAFRSAHPGTDLTEDHLTSFDGVEIPVAVLRDGARGADDGAQGEGPATGRRGDPGHGGDGPGGDPGSRGGLPAQGAGGGLPVQGHGGDEPGGDPGSRGGLPAQEPGGDLPTQGPGPLFVSLHGGGLVMGSRYSGLRTVVPWMRRYGGVVVSPEYRLAPESPAPTAVEDCYATVCWAVDNAAALGADPGRVVLVGASAGGGLALGVLLMARDRHGPQVLGALADYPMLDDRTGQEDGSVSGLQYLHQGTWPSAYNNVAWEAALGQRRGTGAVSPYEAPARATWLGDLPPVFLSVASAEPFRDEVVALASALWRDGGVAELHVFPGGTHAMEEVSTTWLARGLGAARDAWVERLLVPEDPGTNLLAVARAGTYPALSEQVLAGASPLAQGPLEGLEVLHHGAAVGLDVP